jgi:hypothetical protein
MALPPVISQAFFKAAHFAILTNLYIAAGAVAFGMANARLLGFEANRFWILWCHVGAATWLVYQLSRWTFHQRRLSSPKVDAIYRWLDQHKSFTIGSILISSIVMLSSFFLLKEATRWTLIAMGAIAVLYPLEIPVAKKQKIRLRDLPFLKIFLIALVWSGMAVLLPATEAGGWDALNSKSIGLCMLQFLFILSITLPFDINDWRIDRMTGVKTIPHILGIRKSQHLTLGISLLYWLGMWAWSYGHLQHGNTALLYCVGLALLLTSLNFMTLRHSSTASKWRIMLWFDGSFFWYWLIVLISMLAGQ